MKALKALFQINVAGDDASDDAVRFDAFSDSASRPRSRSELVRWGSTFADRLILLLAHWNSRRVEREALAYALRWDGCSKLAAEVDRASEYCLAWLDELRGVYQDATGRAELRPKDLMEVQALELIRQNAFQLLDDLRSRAEFLSTRAADIRISGDLQKTAGALLSLEPERLAGKVADALRTQLANPESDALAKVVAEHPELEKAAPADLERFGKRVGDRMGGLANARDWLVQNAGQVAVGVAANTAYALLKAMFPGVVP
jgi:hypothetical protein